MVLVTGANGFVGSTLIRQLCLQHIAVKALIRDKHKIPRDLSGVSGIEWVEGNILDIASLANAFMGIKQVYHCAAIISYESRDHDQMFKTNVEGTANIVNACLLSGVEKLLHVSSIAAIGGQPDMSISETTKWEKTRLTSNYGLTKHLAEREVFRGIAEGLHSVILNPGIIIGEGNWATGTGRFWVNIDKGLKYTSSGGNGFVDVKDVVDAMILAMECAPSGEKYILVGENLAFLSFFEKIASCVGKKTKFLVAGNFYQKVYATYDKMRSWITGRKRKITFESIRIANQSFIYTSDKILSGLGFSFTPMDSTITRISEAYMKEFNQS